MREGLKEIETRQTKSSTVISIPARNRCLITDSIIFGAVRQPETRPCNFLFLFPSVLRGSPEKHRASSRAEIRRSRTGFKIIKTRQGWKDKRPGYLPITLGDDVRAGKEKNGRRGVAWGGAAAVGGSSDRRTKKNTDLIKVKYALPAMWVIILDLCVNPFPGTLSHPPSRAATPTQPLPLAALESSENLPFIPRLGFLFVFACALYRRAKKTERREREGVRKGWRAI